jgi:CheY-like chemotaxis protein
MTLRVFIADDSITIQKIVSLAFCGEDATIEAVSDGESAFESLRLFKPDIVLADVFMPGCSGYELCARIKEDPDLKKIPVVLLVGTFEPFDVSEAARVKCDGHLTKPFDTEELIQTIQRLVGDWHTVEVAPLVRTRKAMVSTAALQSFTGENRILDIFDPDIAAAGASIPRSAAAPVQIAAEPVISEETLKMIVDRVVQKMSPEIIRDVAWEVVPELSEAIIRSTMKNS